MTEWLSTISGRGLADSAAAVNERAERLLTVADRCEREEPSRELDGAIYCAVHDLVDLNGLHTDELRNARDDGEVVAANHRDVVVGWLESPAYTSDMEDARTLLDARPDVEPSEPMRVCALALRIRAAQG